MSARITGTNVSIDHKKSFLNHYKILNLPFDIEQEFHLNVFKFDGELVSKTCVRELSCRVTVMTPAEQRLANNPWDERILLRTTLEPGK